MPNRSIVAESGTPEAHGRRPSRGAPRLRRVLGIAAAAVLVASIGGGVGWLPGPASAHADDLDVPAEHREIYDKAAEHYASGDAKRIKKAWSLLNRLKDEAARSADYWTLYWTVWQAAGKKHDHFWDNIFAKREAEHPNCPAFDIFRSRIADSDEDRRKHLEAALEKQPDLMEAHLGIIDMLIEAEEEYDAEEMVDALLEKYEGHEDLLERKGMLMLVYDRVRPALALAEENLEKQKSAAMLHLKALCVLKLLEGEGEGEPAELEAGAKAAIDAVSMKPASRYLVTAARLLDATGKEDEAAALLTKHASNLDARGRALHGEYLLRAGDFRAAAERLAGRAKSDPAVASALAQCWSFVGEKEKAIAVAEQLLEMDEAYRASALWYLIDAGAHDKAAAAIEATEDEGLARWARGSLLKAQGDLAGYTKHHADEFAGGGHQAESIVLDYLWLRLRVGAGSAVTRFESELEKIGQRLCEAGVAQAEIPDERRVSLAGKNVSFWQHACGYVRSRAGRPFQAASGPVPLPGSAGDGAAPKLIFGIAATSSDVADPIRFVAFLEVDLSAGGGSINMEDGGWGTALASFRTGNEKMLEGEIAAAVEAWDAAAEAETSWHRPVLHKAVLRAAEDPSVRGEMATVAWATTASFPQDFEARRIALALRAISGDDIKKDAEDLLRQMIAHSPRRLDNFRR